MKSLFAIEYQTGSPFQRRSSLFSPKVSDMDFPLDYALSCYNTEIPIVGSGWYVCYGEIHASCMDSRRIV